MTASIAALSEQDFYAAITHFASQKGYTATDPTVGQARLSLYKLYLHVIEAGGFQRVTTDHAWKRIADRFSFPPSYTTSAQLKQIYTKYILDLERTQRTAKGPALSATFTRIIRSFDSGFPNEAQWALAELSQLTARQQWPSDAFRALFRMVGEALARQERPFFVQQGISLAWNAAVTWSPVPILAIPAAFDSFVGQCSVHFEALLALKVGKVFVDLVDLVAREGDSQIDPEASKLDLLIPLLLKSEDRALRVQGLGLCSALCASSSWCLGSCGMLVQSALLNLYVPDDQLQTAATDFLFFLSDVLEQFPEHCANLDIAAVIQGLFHVILDSFSLGRHIKNIPYRSIFRSASSPTQLASKWLLLCYAVSAPLEGSSLSAACVYREFVGFCEREALDCVLELDTFTAIACATFKVPLEGGGDNLPISPRNWNDRPVKTTEKVVTAILTLRNLAMLPYPETRAFVEHLGVISELASSTANQFVARQFACILEELFGGGL